MSAEPVVQHLKSTPAAASPRRRKRGSKTPDGHAGEEDSEGGSTVVTILPRRSEVVEASARQTEGEGECTGGPRGDRPQSKRPPLQRKSLSMRLLRMVTFNSLPDWQQDNEYLKTHHRVATHSFRRSFKTLFSVHTETVNIWSHVIAFFLCLFLCVKAFILGDEVAKEIWDVNISDLPLSDKLMVFLFLLSSMGLFLCSFLFHLLCNHSEDVSLMFGKLDYLGIILSFAGQSSNAYYFGFYCSSIVKLCYIVVLVVLCSVCVAVILLDRFGTPEMRPIRFGVFFLLGLSNIVPLIHIGLVNGFWLVFVEWGVGNSSLLLESGAILFVLQVPERFAPGVFDVLGNSHQLFHLIVLIAIVFHYSCILNMIHHRLYVDPSCP